MQENEWRMEMSECKRKIAAAVEETSENYFKNDKMVLKPIN